jgi:hypothetical protein
MVGNWGSTTFFLGVGDARKHEAAEEEECFHGSLLSGTVLTVAVNFSKCAHHVYRGFF